MGFTSENKKINDYFSIYPGTPPFNVNGDRRCSVHKGNSYRLEQAKKQMAIPPTQIDKIIEYVNELFDLIGIKNTKSPITKPSDIDYKSIKEKNRLASERDIVWMKFLDDGHLGVVATGNDINFDIPKCKEDYDLSELKYNSYKKKYVYEWVHNTSGILVHQLGKEWDKSFVLIFPLPNIPRPYKRGDIERAVGNFLISKGVSIIDFYSHNY